MDDTLTDRDCRACGRDPSSDLSLCDDCAYRQALGRPVGRRLSITHHPMSPDLSALLSDGCGESLTEEMEARGLTTDQLALASGLGRSKLDAILSSKLVVTQNISRAISLGLGEPLISDGFWARLDANIRRDRARINPHGPRAGR